jgi:sulfur relay (sulfurtransferase) complex TusBCD TusD component (DsrE family)
VTTALARFLLGSGGKEARMPSYLFIAEGDPLDSMATQRALDLAGSLAHAGERVTVFFVQNGVLAARAGNESNLTLAALQAAGVELLADTFALLERGITGRRLAAGVRTASLDAIVDGLVEGRRVLWS